jgi:hypothetical protein
MKNFLLTGFAFLSMAAIGIAEEANGLRLTAQKTLLEKTSDRDSDAYWEKVDKALGLKTMLQNVSLKAMPEGSMEYIVIVKRWGHTPTLYEKYEGTEKVPALLAGGKAELTVAKVPIAGYEAGGNRKLYQDSVEAWQIKVSHEGKETVKLTSTSAFEKLLAKAKPGR